MTVLDNMQENHTRAELDAIQQLTLGLECPCFELAEVLPKEEWVGFHVQVFMERYNEE